MAALVDKVNALVVSSTGGSSAVEDEEDEETGEAANELNALRDLESQLARRRRRGHALQRRRACHSRRARWRRDLSAPRRNSAARSP